MRIPITDSVTFFTVDGPQGRLLPATIAPNRCDTGSWYASLELTKAQARVLSHALMTWADEDPK